MRYFIELSYKGKNYCGWQIQPNANTVQEEIQNALSKILRTPISCMAAGRTDTGVHASQMFIHLDTDIEIDSPKYIYKFNAVLPDDIAIYSIFRVKDDAHTRFNAISRSYEYQVLQARNPFLLDTTWQIPNSKLNVALMNEAAKLLLKYTNYKCFSKSKTDVKTYNCTITNAEWIVTDNLLVFHISADRFLRNMVRAIVGTLVEIGQGKKSISDFIKIIESEDRNMAGPSAPAKGLMLTPLNYPENIKYN